MRFEELKAAVNQLVEEQASHEALILEARRVFGPSFDGRSTLVETAKEINTKLDESRQAHAFNVSVVRQFVQHPEAEVRKMAIRVLPTPFSHRAIVDRSESVRQAAALKAPLRLVKEAAVRLQDKNLLKIFKQRKLTEVTPAVGHHSRQRIDVELSDVWYEELARKLIADYGNNLESNWEESAVMNIVRGMKSVSNLELDVPKLLKYVKKGLEGRGDALASEEDRWPRRRITIESASRRQNLEELDESVDPVKSLTAIRAPGEFINRVDEVFRVNHALVPRSLRKHLSEKFDRPAPASATVPTGQFSSLVESVLDTYVKHWNNQRALAGEPIKLSWYVHPLGAGRVGFQIDLK